MPINAYNDIKNKQYDFFIIRTEPIFLLLKNKYNCDILSH